VDAFVVGSGLFGAGAYPATFARMRAEAQRGSKSAGGPNPPEAAR
jgi:hypothetical protein